MPLEFRCNSCSKLLRTPDESAGKKAKCPQCGAIVDVPLESAEQPTAGEESAPTGEIERNPFQDTPQQVDGPINPYAAPTTIAAAPPEISPKGELRHTEVTFDDILRKSWEFFTENIAQLAIFGIVLFAITFALQVVSQLAGFAAEATGELPIIIAVAVVSTVFDMAVQIYLGLGATIYTIKMARTRQANVSDLFTAGPYFLRGLGVGMLIFVICVLIAGVCLIPGGATVPFEEPMITAPLLVGGALVAGVLCFIVWLRYMLSFFFIIDLDAGISQSMRQSAHYMTGNKLTVFLLMLVVGFLGGMFVCFTCCIGNILYLPYYNIMLAMTYLSVTGQQPTTTDASVIVS